MRKAQRLVEPRAAGNCCCINEAKGAKRNRQSDEDASQAAAHAERQIAAARRNHQPGQIGKERPEQPAGALRSEIKRHAKPKQAVGGANHLEVARAGVEHLRRGIEQRQPGVRRYRGAKPNQFA